MKTLKNLQKSMSLIAVCILCFSFSACSMMKDEIAARKDDKEYCVLNMNDATQFTCGGTEYTILEDKTDREALGAWIGYIQKFAVLNESYKVLDLRDIDLDASQNLPEHVAYIVQFFNIYTCAESNDSLVIDVNGSFHKAIPTSKANADTPVISYEAEGVGSQKGELYISPSNCTQIILGGKTYQITDVKVSESELDGYIGFIGERKVFDANTNKEIPREDLDDIEVSPGELSKQQRVSWQYGLVYGILNANQSIAVQINNTYLRANMIE